MLITVEEIIVFLVVYSLITSFLTWSIVKMISRVKEKRSQENLKPKPCNHCGRIDCGYITLNCNPPRMVTSCGFPIKYEKADKDKEGYYLYD